MKATTGGCSSKTPHATRATSARGTDSPPREVSHVIGLSSTSPPPANRRRTFWEGIALAGGVDSKWPVSPEEWERRASEMLAPGPLGFIAGGAGSGSTIRANREAFERWRLVPRMLGSSPSRDLSVEVLGTRSPAPVFLAPIGLQTIANPEGELASARAAEAVGLPFVVSTASSYSMEEIAQEMPSTPRWFQLYFVDDRGVVESLIRRAEASGHKALVVTLDTPMLGWRERDLGNKAYLPFRDGEGIAHFATDPVFRSRLGFDPLKEPTRAGAEFVKIFTTPRNFALRWEDVRWLKTLTALPLLVKGILSGEDASRALDNGADGIIVSNHGGRQVDGAIAALDALIDVRDAINGRCPILMDSGVRRGSDVLKALALGASAVLLGRPYLYGLVVGGEEGVEAVLWNLLADTDRTMALCGRAAIREVDAALVAGRP